MFFLLLLIAATFFLWVTIRRVSRPQSRRWSRFERNIQYTDNKEDDEILDK